MHRIKRIDGETYVSQREAASRIGVCQATMARIILKGTLKARRIDGVRSVWVKESDLESLVRGLSYGSTD
jgi:hypothetical protein